MNALIVSFILFTGAGFAAGFSIFVELMLAFGFLLVVKQVYSPDNQERFIEESLIPLNDDSLEEKYILEGKHIFRV